MDPRDKAARQHLRLVLDCGEVREVLVEGDPTRMRSTAVRAHMADCEDCQDFHALISGGELPLASVLPEPSPSRIGIPQSSPRAVQGRTPALGALLAAALIGAAAATVANQVEFPSLRGDQPAFDTRIVGPGATPVEGRDVVSSEHQTPPSGDKRRGPGDRELDDEMAAAPTLVGGALVQAHATRGDGGPRKSGSNSGKGPPRHAAKGRRGPAGNGIDEAPTTLRSTDPGSSAPAPAGAAGSPAPSSGTPPAHANGRGNPH